MEADFIAYEALLYQVLSLDPAPSASEPIGQDRGPRRLADVQRDARKRS